MQSAPSSYVLASHNCNSENSPFLQYCQISVKFSDVSHSFLSSATMCNLTVIQPSENHVFSKSLTTSFHVLISGRSYTADEDFLNADAVFDCIGDPPEERFDLTFCGNLLEKQCVS